MGLQKPPEAPETRRVVAQNTNGNIMLNITVGCRPQPDLWLVHLTRDEAQDLAKDLIACLKGEYNGPETEPKKPLENLIVFKKPDKEQATIPSM